MPGNRNRTPPAPKHLDAVGKATWTETIATLTQLGRFDVSDTFVLVTLCELTQLERLAWAACRKNVADDKAMLNYARLQKQRLAVLDAMGLSAKSRSKIGIDTRDDEAEGLASFCRESPRNGEVDTDEE